MRRPIRSSCALALVAAACADPVTPTRQAVGPAPHEHAGAASTAAVDAFHSLLRPGNEVRPGTTDPVINSVARATGQVRLLEDGRVEFAFTVDNPDREQFVAGHIHEAPAGSNGGIVVGFFGPPTQPPLSTPLSDATIELTGVGDFNVAEAAALVERIRTTPENFYLNLHTVVEPAGATRGQLGAGPQLDALAVASRETAAAGGLPAKEMLRFRLRQSDAEGPWQVRVDWGDGRVTYTPLAALPFFGVFLHGYAESGTYRVSIQGGLDVGPASAPQTVDIVVP
jgi:hypothetical protein